MTIENDYIVHTIENYNRCISRLQSKTNLSIWVGFTFLGLLFLSLVLNTFIPSDVWHYMAYLGVSGFMSTGIFLSTNFLDKAEISEIAYLQENFINHLDIKVLNDISKLGIDEKSQSLVSEITPHNEHALFALYQLWQYTPI